MSQIQVVPAPLSFRRRAAAWGFVIATAAMVFAVRAHAQSNTSSFTLRPSVGALVGTGDMSDALKSAVVVGGQASWHVHPNLSLVGSFAYSPSVDKLTPTQPKLNVYQYDIGIEGRLGNLTPGSGISTRPYAAIGGGGRTYDYRNMSGTSAQTNVLGYGAVGLDVAQASGPVGIRIEVRDNVTGFKGFRGELFERKARNDLQIAAGLTFAF